MDISEIKSLLEKQGTAIKASLAEYDDEIARIKGHYQGLAQQVFEGGRLSPRMGGDASSTVRADADLMLKMRDDPQVKAWLSGESTRIVNSVALPYSLGSAMMSVKTALTNVSGGLQNDQRLPGITGLSARARWLWQYLPIAPASGSSVTYVRETGSFRTAGLQSSEGEDKQESSYTTEPQTRDFETVAHWTQVSRQALSDNGELGMFLDGRLRQGLWAKLEQQLINGNGTSPQLSGLIDAGNFTAYTGNSTSDGLSKLDHMRDAIKVLQLANYSAGLFIVNPADWFDVETERGTDGQYTWAQPASMLPPTAWGLPVHVTTDMPSGNFVCMDPQAATVFFRQEAEVIVGAHGDGLVRNLTTMLCEGRFALAVHRPEAVLYGSFDN